MEVKISGYAKTITSRKLPNGNIIYKETMRYFPDGETEILQSTDNELHDLTDAELNEIMAELEAGPKVIDDAYPLKNIREKILNE